MRRGKALNRLTDDAGPDEVRLEFPALSEYFRLARLTAAGLGSRLGFTVDQVEDLKLAIDELCFGLTGPDLRSGTLTVRYRLGRDLIEVSGESSFDDDQSTPAQSELSRIILDALVDEHEFHRESPSSRFWILKRRVPG